MVNTLLINSPLFRDKVENYLEDSLPLLGLGYIATELKKSNITVNIVDSVSKNIPLEKLVEFIESQKPEFIGLNIFSTNFCLVQEIIERIKSKTHFLVGGQTTKSTYEKIITFNTKNPLDIIIGDGEYIT